MPEDVAGQQTEPTAEPAAAAPDAEVPAAVGIDPQEFKTAVGRVQRIETKTAEQIATLTKTVEDLTGQVQQLLGAVETEKQRTAEATSKSAKVEAEADQTVAAVAQEVAAVYEPRVAALEARNAQLEQQQIMAARRDALIREGASAEAAERLVHLVSGNTPDEIADSVAVIKAGLPAVFVRPDPSIQTISSAGGSPANKTKPATPTLKDLVEEELTKLPASMSGRKTTALREATRRLAQGVAAERS
jgi:hypothetical protein